jgi:hypothetical protein
MRDAKRIVKAIRSSELCWLFLVSCFWVIGSYPAILTGDSLDSWNQVKTLNFDDAHPVISTLFLWTTSLGGNFLWLAAFVQISLMQLAIFLILRSFLPNHESYKLVRLTSLLVFLPIIGAFSVTIWKDIPFTAFIMIGISGLLFPEGKSLKCLAFYGSLFGFGLCFRHDGWPLSVLFVSFLLIAKGIPLFKRNGIKNQVILVIALSTFVPIILQPASVSLVKATPMQPWFNYSSFYGDLFYLYAVSPNSMNPESRALMGQIIKGDALAGARNCTTIDGVIFNSGFDANKANEFRNRILHIWLESFKKNPETISWARYCRGAAFLPPPFANPPQNYAFIAVGTANDHPLSIKSEPLVPFLHSLTVAWISLWQLNGQIMGWPGLYLFLFILIFMITPIARRNSAWVLILALICSRSVFLVFFAGAPDFRYAALVQILSLCLLTAARENHRGVKVI